MSDTITILYFLHQIDTNNETIDYPNAFEIKHPHDHQIVLADLIKHFKILDIDKSRYEVCLQSNQYIPVDSLATTLPIITKSNGHKTITLKLFSASAPPYSPLEQAHDFFSLSTNGNILYSNVNTRNKNTKQSNTFESNISNQDNIQTQRESPNYQPNRSDNNPRISSLFADEDAFQPLKNLVSKENVIAIGEASLEVGKKAASFADATARGLFSFAKQSLQTLTDNAIVLDTIKMGRYSVTIKKLIAEGGFGSVYLAADSKGEFALKKLNCQSNDQITEAKEELNALLKFNNCDNIIRLLDHTTVKSGSHTIIYMLFPLFEYGTTWDIVENAIIDTSRRWPFSQARILHIIKGVSRGLDVMHTAGIAHRDIKPHNILIDKDSNPVIMDLGSVTAARVTVSSRRQASILQEDAAIKASAPYRAPELTETPSEIVIDERIDIWSLGCTCYCLAFGNSPFESPKEGVLRLAILNGKYKIPDPLRNRECVYNQAFMDAIQNMLEVNHKNRPFARDVFEMCEQMMM